MVSAALKARNEDKMEAERPPLRVDSLSLEGGNPLLEMEDRIDEDQDTAGGDDQTLYS